MNPLGPMPEWFPVAATVTLVVLSCAVAVALGVLLRVAWRRL